MVFSLLRLQWQNEIKSLDKCTAKGYKALQEEIVQHFDQQVQKTARIRTWRKIFKAEDDCLDQEQ